MVLFSIPDIRLFWSSDPRFLSQFTPGEITSFKPYSKYPPVLRDMSFWIPEPPTADEDRRDWHENDYCEIVRDIAGDLVETVQLVSVDYTSSRSRLTQCRSTSSRTQRLGGGARLIA